MTKLPEAPSFHNTPIELLRAFVEADESFGQINRAKWLRGLQLIESVAEKSAVFTELLLLEGGVDLNYGAGNTIAHAHSEVFHLVVASMAIQSDPAWRDLDEAMRTPFANFAASWTAARAEERAKADALESARGALRDAEGALQIALLEADDSGLVKARADLIAARETLAALQ